MLGLIVRTLVLYVFVILAVRLMGKKQISELQPSELVTTIIISNVVTISLEETSVSLMAGVIPIILIVSLDVLITGVNLKSEIIRKLFTGTPRVIISNGEIDQKAMRGLRYTIDDLVESMREEGIFDIDDVQFAIVENTGKISFFEKAGGGSGEEGGDLCDPKAVVIKDGKIDKGGVKLSGKDERWIHRILNEEKLSVKDVFFMAADSMGEYSLIKKD